MPRVARLSSSETTPQKKPSNRRPLELARLESLPSPPPNPREGPLKTHLDGESSPRFPSATSNEQRRHAAVSGPRAPKTDKPAASAARASSRRVTAPTCRRERRRESGR